MVQSKLLLAQPALKKVLAERSLMLKILCQGQHPPSGCCGYWVVVNAAECEGRWSW